MWSPDSALLIQPEAVRSALLVAFALDGTQAGRGYATCAVVVPVV